MRLAQVSWATGCLAGAGTGVLFGLAFPPFSWSWLIWVCLVPMLYVCRREGSGARALIVVGLAGLVAFLLAAYPLTSASVWSGWASTTREQVGAAQAAQWWALHGLWVLICLVIAAFWVLFAAAIRWLEPRGLLAFAVIPAAWVLLAEWARAGTLWGFQWGFLGNSVAAFDAVRQSASLGGVWLLSVLAVGFNLAIVEVIQAPSRRYRIGLLSALIVLAALTLGFGWWRVGTTRRPVVEAQEVRAVALQGQEVDYVASDFLEFGLDRDYYEQLEKVYGTGPDLIVLPESVSYGPVSLDGTSAPGRDPRVQRSVSAWNAAIGSLLYESDAVVVIGADTAEGSKAYNSMLGWQGGQLLGWYHKVRLVPFSEYRPRLWSRSVLESARGYSFGAGERLLETHGFVLGPFICQEVQFPQLLRRRVLSGAEILVSGGNDGVFGNPAVAEVHDAMASLRATETGRYLVRAMKNGVSSIIDAHGNHLARAPVGESGPISATVYPLRDSTIYSRFGDWPLWLSAVVVTVAAVVRFQRRSTLLGA